MQIFESDTTIKKDRALVSIALGKTQLQTFLDSKYIAVDKSNEVSQSEYNNYSEQNNEIFCQIKY